jgi:NAD(P)-dependent dehydrogenase (short-subunit alcohol dehydrogenase family)
VRFVSAAAAAFGGIDGLANVAADVRVETMAKDVDILGMDANIWEQVLRAQN